MRDIGHMQGHFRAELFDQYGNIKQIVDRSNLLSFQNMRYTLYSTYTYNPTPIYLWLLSSDTSQPTSNDNGDGTGSDVTGFWEWVWTNRVSALATVIRPAVASINTAAATPYWQQYWDMTTGVATGTIKTAFYTGANSGSGGGWSRISIGAAVVLLPEEWIYKAALDTLRITWTVYLSGPFKTRNQY